MNGNGNGRIKRNASPEDLEKVEQLGRYLGLFLVLIFVWSSINHRRQSVVDKTLPPRPPFNAEYLLYLLLRRDEREVVVGDLIEGYGKVLERFDKLRADIWFYKQVIGSVLPLLRRALLRVGALIWVGRVLRRLIS